MREENKMGSIETDNQNFNNIAQLDEENLNRINAPSEIEEEKDQLDSAKKSDLRPKVIFMKSLVNSEAEKTKKTTHRQEESERQSSN